MKKNIKLEFLDKTTDLFLTSLGLVAALAWNEAIQAIVKEFFPEQNGLWPKILYALLLTVILVIVSWRLNKLMKLLKVEEEKELEVK